MFWLGYTLLQNKTREVVCDLVSIRTPVRKRSKVTHKIREMLDSVMYVANALHALVYISVRTHMPTQVAHMLRRC